MSDDIGHENWSDDRAPGVSLWEPYSPPAQVSGLETGVPVFLGYAKPLPQEQTRKVSQQARRRPPWKLLSSWEDFGRHFGRGEDGSYLAPAVKGFFQNGGLRCYVMPISDSPGKVQSFEKALTDLDGLESIDLVCAPDIMKSGHVGKKSDLGLIRDMQGAVLAHCDRTGDRFAILDSPPAVTKDQALDARRGLISENGAMYYPWLRVEDGAGGAGDWIPPCGHIAGIYARTDAEVGVFKTPANARIEGVVDLAVHLRDEEQGPLNKRGINCLRYLGGRGIRVWGARTLSGLPDRTYVNVRRLFITLGRWIRQYQTQVCFEPHTEELWARIERDVTVYLGELFQRGGLKGDTPSHAFYVKCNAETNVSLPREEGRVVTEVGLCPRLPGEFIRVQVVQKPDGVHIVGVP